MPRKELSQSETLQVLAVQNLVRIAFRDGQSSYLVPMGYVWAAPVLFGVTDIGRKTRLAEKNPKVSFQVDTSNDTGLWEWRSVTGEGKFEIVDNDEERQQLFEALQQIIGEAPDWWRAEQGPRMASGALLVWKVTPTSVTGCEYVRPDDSTR